MYAIDVPSDNPHCMQRFESHVCRKPATMSQSLLPADWAVPQAFRDRLGDHAGRQRAMTAEGHLLLVLHKVPDAGDTTREPRIIWRHPDGTWKCTDGTEGRAAMEAHLAEYARVLVSLDDEEHKADGAQQYVRVLVRLSPVLRAVRHLHSTLQEAREACPDERELINARDEAYRQERTCELLISDAKSTLDVAALQHDEELAETNLALAQSAHRLNMLAAFFFPLATLCSVFGVSFAFPLKDDPTHTPFYGMLIIGLVVGFILAIIIRPKGLR